MAKKAQGKKSQEGPKQTKIKVRINAEALDLIELGLSNATIKEEISKILKTPQRNIRIYTDKVDTKSEAFIDAIKELLNRNDLIAPGFPDKDTRRKIVTFLNDHGYDYIPKDEYGIYLNYIYEYYYNSDIARMNYTNSVAILVGFICSSKMLINFLNKDKKFNKRKGARGTVSKSKIETEMFK